MKKLIGLMLALMMLAAAASAALAESQGTEMYVYTENGKGLTVRSTMNTTDDNFVDSLPYGFKVFTYGSPKPGWTYIEYGNQHGYVMSRFLVKAKPAPFVFRQIGYALQRDSPAHPRQRLGIPALASEPEFRTDGYLRRELSADGNR